MTTALRSPAGAGRKEVEFDLAPPAGVRTRRLPELGAGLLLVVVCMLGVLWWQASSTARQPALALQVPVERGEVVELSDLQVVQIDTDDAVNFLSDADAAVIVGRTALVDLPAGALVSPSMFTAGSTLETGEGVVGLSLEAGQLPSLRLTTGDIVAVVLTPSPGDPKAFDDTIDGTLLVERAAVVEVEPVGVQGGLFVALQVGEQDAARVATAASSSRVRLIQVSEVQQ
ncbi:MAG: SAF domain-containing protein [Acidimicrobiales bacterium]|nr:SAF domain-containing protein [Acidimicrobiales bacterium]